MVTAPNRMLDALQERLGYRFAQLDLLHEALMHRSWLNEAEDRTLRSNERLEYLGDAALEAFVSQLLYRSFPDANEGWLTVARASLVNNETLARVARSVELGECLTVAPGFARDGGRNQTRVLSCALEAIIGAVWLDGGDDEARDLIERLMQSRIAELSSDREIADAKSRLQHHTQRRDGSMPAYRIVDRSGPDHDRQFRAEVLVNGDVVAAGQGRSKQAAERDAAANALDALSGQLD